MVRTVNQIKYRKLIIAMIVFSCFYKIAVINEGVLHNLFAPLTNYLPFSDIVQYSRSISIIRVPFLGLVLHFLFTIVWVYNLKGNIRIKYSSVFILLILIIFIRFISEIIFNSNMSSYLFGLYFLYFITILFFYSINTNVKDFEYYTLCIEWCIYILGIICALSAIVYYARELNQTLNLFLFRYYRIGGFMFDSIISGFIYGVALISAFELKKNNYLSKYILFASIIIFVTGCLLSGSRSSFYFLGIAIWYYLRTGKNIWKFVIFPLLIIAGIVLYNSFLSGANTSFTSDGARIYKYQLALNIFFDHPFFGVGSNMFYSYDNIYGSNPHNLPLTMLSENGILGFIIYLLWFCINIYNVVKTRNSYWKWMNISVMLLSMILGIFTNIITIIFLVMTSWGCDISNERSFGVDIRVNV